MSRLDLLLMLRYVRCRYSPLNLEADWSLRQWLHRNAFHFGGLNDTVNLASSQTRENLVFGTGESNTHMIRAENTISSLLRVDALISQDDKRTGTLVTTNLFKGVIHRLDLATQGFFKTENIPTWADKEKYSMYTNALKSNC